MIQIAAYDPDDQDVIGFDYTASVSTLSDARRSELAVFYTLSGGSSKFSQEAFDKAYPSYSLNKKLLLAIQDFPRYRGISSIVQLESQTEAGRNALQNADQCLEQMVTQYKTGTVKQDEFISAAGRAARSLYQAALDGKNINEKIADYMQNAAEARAALLLMKGGVDTSEVFAQRENSLRSYRMPGMDALQPMLERYMPKPGLRK